MAVKNRLKFWCGHGDHSILYSCCQ